MKYTDFSSLVFKRDGEALGRGMAAQPGIEQVEVYETNRAPDHHVGVDNTTQCARLPSVLDYPVY